MKWDVLISGHVARTGTYEDVAFQPELMNNLKKTTREALNSIKPGIKEKKEAPASFLYQTT